MYSKTCLRRPLKKKTKLFLKTDYRLMQVKSFAECYKHSAMLLTFIKLPLVIKIFVLSILSGRLRRVLLYVPCICYATLGALSSYAITLLGKRKMVVYF